MRAVFVVVALIASSCATTKVVDSWKADGAEPLKAGAKRAVVVIGPNAERRDRAEKDLAQKLNAASLRGMFTPEELQDRDAVRQRLVTEGFEDLIVMRVDGVREERSRVHVPAWTNYPTLMGPTIAGQTKVDVTTSVYKLSAGEGEMIWEFRSETIDPTSVDAMMDSLVEAGLQQLKNDGLYPTGA